MNSFNIDTDAAIGSVLSNFSTEYIMHVVTDSLEHKFRPFDGPMPNMVDVLERNFLSVLANAPDYVAETNDVRSKTYIEIIEIISRAYQLEYTEDLSTFKIDELYGIARSLYDVLVARFTDNMIDFFVSYIINNSDDIYNYLKSMDNINRPRNQAFSDENFIDNKYILIHANANMVIYNIAGYDISMSELFHYFFPAPVADRILSIFSDGGDLFKYHYASYIKDITKSPEIITRIKLALQSRTFTGGNNNGRNEADYK